MCVAGAKAISLLVGMTVLGLYLCACATAQTPAPRVLAFVSRVDGDRELQQLARHGRCIDVVAPNWLALDVASAKIAGQANPDVVEMATGTGAKLWPTVNAQLDASPRIHDAAWRQRVADAVLAAAERLGVRGMTLDIEGAAADARQAVNDLVSRTAAQLHATGRRLAVYAPRRTASHVGPTAAAYDPGQLARRADVVALSAYNEHSASSTPGPIQTERGVNAVASHARHAGPRNIALTLGAFGYDWPPGGGAGTLIPAYAAINRWGGAGERGVRTVGGHTVFYTTLASLRAGVEAQQEHHLRWLALFSLGREPEAMWRGLRTARCPGRRPS